jgi:hypothetical protein
MAIARQLTHYAGRRVTRRLSRAVPWIGGLLALATIADTMRRKGVLAGALDTALDFTPVVGTLKNTAEVVRGRDFIRERRNVKIHEHIPVTAKTS